MNKPTAEQRIELIKWGVKFASEFRFKEDGTGSYCLMISGWEAWNGGEQFNDIYYPLFLDRVCQGINQYPTDIDFQTFGNRIEIVNDNDKIFEEFMIVDSVDETREQALIWLMEEMKG